VQSDPAPAAAITDSTEEVTTTEAPTTTEEETTEAPTEAPTAAPTAASTAATTTTTKAPATGIELSKYISTNNDGLFTLSGAEMAKLLGYNSHVYRKSYEQDTWHTYSNSAGSEIGCGGNDDGRNADVIGLVLIKDSTAALYGLRVGDPLPQLDFLAAYGYAGRVNEGGCIFYLEQGNDNGTDRIIRFRTNDDKTISEIRYSPQVM